VKSSSQTENNAAKTMALDHLGVIAARIRSSMLKTKQCADTDGFVGLKALDEVLPPSLDPFYVLIFMKVLSRGSLQHFERLAAAHQDLATHLAKRSAQDQAYEVSIRYCHV
jgi:cohesin loading factor subunit SCC2